MEPGLRQVEVFLMEAQESEAGSRCHPALRRLVSAVQDQEERNLEIRSRQRKEALTDCLGIPEAVGSAPSCVGSQSGRP